MLLRQATISQENNKRPTFYFMNAPCLFFIDYQIRIGNVVKCHCVIAQFAENCEINIPQEGLTSSSPCVIFLVSFSIFHFRAIMASKNTKPRAQTYSLLTDVQKNVLKRHFNISTFRHFDISTALLAHGVTYSTLYNLIYSSI